MNANANLPPRSLLLVTLATALAIPLLACGGGGAEKPPKWPPRPVGCEVALFRETPAMPTENLGPVTAKCGESIPEAECLRTLKDQTCKLGGDVVWGVTDKMPEPGHYRLMGRAAHRSGSAK